MFDVELERLERELLAGQDTLRRSLAELETTYEELQASTEELQGASEELEAAYEELETANEELQAVNEELGGLNQQYRARGDRLQVLNDDLENIQSSLNQGLVVLDADLRVTRFTPLAVRVFALVRPTSEPAVGGAHHRGHPRAVRRVGHPWLSAGNRAVWKSSAAGRGRRAYLVVLPTRGRGKARGAIVTLTDVTDMTSLSRRAHGPCRI